MLWHPQEANANLQLCHFSPHRHPKCCSCEVMSVVMVTVCEPGIAHPLTSLLPPSARSSLSLPPSLAAYPLAHSLLPLTCQEINRWNKCEVIAETQAPRSSLTIVHESRWDLLLGEGEEGFGYMCGGGGETAECVSAKITSISLLWGDCRKGPTYLCSEECLSVSDRQEQWRCKRVDNDAFSILQLQNQRQAARGAATRRQTPLTPIISRPPHLSLPSPPNWLEKTNIHGLFFSLAFSRNLPFWQKETETAEWNFLTDEHTVVCVCVWESACIPVFCMRKCFFSHLSRASLCWDINLAMWFITASTHQHVSSEEHHGCLKEPANMQRSHYTRFYTH